MTFKMETILFLIVNNLKKERIRMWKAADSRDKRILVHLDARSIA